LEGNGAEVVEAVEVIGMVMREQHGMHRRRSDSQQLQPKLWRRINQKVAAGQAKKHGTPIAVVAGV
jgi:hypothetical protein